MGCTTTKENGSATISKKGKNTHPYGSLLWQLDNAATFTDHQLQLTVKQMVPETMSHNTNDDGDLVRQSASVLCTDTWLYLCKSNPEVYSQQAQATEEARIDQGFLYFAKEDGVK